MLMQKILPYENGCLKLHFKEFYRRKACLTLNIVYEPNLSIAQGERLDA